LDIKKEIAVSWNHRVMKKIFPNGEIEFSIREVYYNDDGTIYAHTEHPIAPTGETIKDLRKILEWMVKSLDNPILVDGEVKFVSYDSDLESEEDSNDLE
jgi:hypothetical protein